MAKLCVRFDDKSLKVQQRVQELFAELGDIIEEMADAGSQNVVYAKLDEALMWVGKAIRDDQVVRSTTKAEGL